MLQYDFDQSLGYWVVTTAQALRKALKVELGKQGITLRQWEVLAWLALQGEMSQAEIAECLGIEAQTLVGILDRMERDGWLDRHPCPDDRRKKRIRATEKSEAVWARMVDCAHEIRARATQGLSPDELTQFKSMCDRIRANLEVPGEIHAPDVPSLETV